MRGHDLAHDVEAHAEAALVPLRRQALEALDPTSFTVERGLTVARRKDAPLRKGLCRGVSSVAEVAAGATRSLADAVRDFERDYVERAVAEAGSKTRAAEKLGISRKTLGTKTREG